MAFNVIQPTAVKHSKMGREEARKTVYAAFYMKDGLNVQIGAAIVERLGWPPECRVIVAEGTGTDAGMLQIRECASIEEQNSSLTFATKYGRTDKAAIAFRIGWRHFKHHKIPEQTQRMTVLVHQTFGGALTIMLPEWMPPIVKT